MSSVVSVIAVVAVLVAVAALWFAFNRNQVGAQQTAPQPLDVNTLKSEMAADLARTVNETVSNSLAEAMNTLSERARADRDEVVKIATEKIATAGTEQLSARAQVIDESLKGISTQMGDRLTLLSQELQQLRQINNTQYTGIEEAVRTLSQRTDNLKEILSSSQKRGAWGERVVEDMLRAVGFIENVNYTKQETNEVGGRPDYKFLMPPNRVMFMDVKFPHDRYADFHNAESDPIRNQARTDFVKAVRGHIDALAKRDYVNNAKEESVDFVLMFLPIESISGFIHESDPTLIDYALSKRVVLCSPMSLYVFLTIVRQATDSFHTEQTAAAIMQQINKFDTEWKKYVEAIDDVKNTYGKLATKIDAIATDGTRHRKLAKPIRDIEKMRRQQGIPELEAEEEFLELSPVDDDE